MQLRWNLKYTVFFVAVFVVEVLIALFVHDNFVRPYVGDVLVVPLVYLFVQSVMQITPWKGAVGTFVFACLVEVGQYFHLVELLGLGDNAAARIIIGTGFEPYDFLAYFVGAALIVGVESVRKRGATAPCSSA